MPLSAHVFAPLSTFPLCFPTAFSLFLTLRLPLIFSCSSITHTHLRSLLLLLYFFFHSHFPYRCFISLPSHPPLFVSRSLSVSSSLPWHLPPPLSASIWRHSNRSVRSRACLTLPIILSRKWRRQKDRWALEEVERGGKEVAEWDCTTPAWLWHVGWMGLFGQQAVGKVGFRLQHF